MTDLAWAPTSCTLPTVARPLREREFAALFATALRRVRRLDAIHAELILDRTSEDVARDLAARETSCCFFFTFDFSSDQEALTMTVTVPPAQAAVLEALVSTAEWDAHLTATGDVA